MTSFRARAIRRRIAIGWLPVLLAFVFGGSMAGCSGASDAAWTSAPGSEAGSEPGSEPVGSGAAAGVGAGGSGPATAGHTIGHAMPTAAEVDAAWAARPGYVQSADARTVEAYAYAIARPDVVDWMPCYCGCIAMDHRNNADCYLKPRSNGEPMVFDEHASYCGICVDITLTAKAMTAEGKSLLQIRIAVDGEYGSAAPGTDTPLPPG